MNIFNRILGTCIVGAALLAGCGGGGGYGGSSTAGINGGGAPTPTPTPTAFAKGVITAFGSIFVNGVEFSTGSSTTFVVDDNPGSQSDLRVGQVVTVLGSVNANGTTGTATQVTFNFEVEGPVAGGSINLPAVTFTVLGQVIHVNGSTLFDNSTLPNGFASLRDGDEVEISGYRDAAGDVIATRIQRRTTPAGTVPFEVSGVVSAWPGSPSTTFKLGSLDVQYPGVTPRNGTMANGACVEVKGSAAVTLLTAASVEIKSCGIGGTSGAHGEVEGIVTQPFVSASDFSIGAQRVITTGTTTLVTNGASAVALNVKVEAEGSFDSSGNLVATKIEIKPDNSLRLLGDISSLTAPGTIVINGVTVQLGAGTRMEDKSSANQSALAFVHLAQSNYVEVRGWPGSAPNTIAAMILERNDPRVLFEIQGVATTTSNNTTTLTILGVTIDTANTSSFKDASGAQITRATFFAQANGKVVKAGSRATQVVPNVFAAEHELQFQSP